MDRDIPRALPLHGYRPSRGCHHGRTYTWLYMLMFTGNGVLFPPQKTGQAACVIFLFSNPHVLYWMKELPFFHDQLLFFLPRCNLGWSKVYPDLCMSSNRFAIARIGSTVVVVETSFKEEPGGRYVALRRSSMGPTNPIFVVDGRNDLVQLSSSCNYSINNCSISFELVDRILWFYWECWIEDP